ncbi:MAG TPA: acyl carrier protein [Nitrosomonas sp.]|uniref:acyl carrier protein n=1 Tax=Nitrosomonas sp. TaxID=42353 RepID=UPI000E96D420|nr:acyl carrier protein [Nitrosomonas sp.]GJL75499.1 MAG: acyl carrier protein [Nitrosomonas sp.]HBV21163.1 acyl carrier protein [Nitrosomonas sp.]HNP25233.1 acyl carrier protein [Nitrosomonas sp.]
MSQDKAAILDQLALIFQDTFTENSCTFSIDTTRDDIEEWDSLSHIRLLTAIEASFGIQFDLDEIGNMTDVATIVDLLHEKLK